MGRRTLIMPSGAFSEFAVLWIAVEGLVWAGQHAEAAALVLLAVLLFISA